MLRFRITRGVGLLATCFALAACGSGSGFQDAAGGPLQPTFASIQANVFTPICGQCHTGAGAPYGLRLDAANSFALLVGVPSGEESSLLRVKPNDPDNSYLIRKLEGTAGTGERMPAGLPPLSQAQIDTIRQWIVDGALPAPAASGPVRVSSLSPLPNSIETALPASITAIFDREIDANTVDNTTFRLERSGGDGTFGDGNEVVIVPTSVTVPLANPRAAVMDLTGVGSVVDVYRVTLVGTGPAPILDLDANALDGEFNGAFPSGNTAAGGDFEAEFDLAGAQPTLQSIQDNIFTPTCSGCHSGGGGQLPQSMDLTSATASFAALVGVTSTEVALERVTPGDADASYLILKLEGDPGIVGGRMPKSGPYLDSATINAVRQWISDGAVQ